ncbi:hypothetical protein E4T38_04516 [Aureobasidium subglaciale]|nr:hypothetical protein E4T38_04516 [Aureobasidium subglaciale]KAI5223924.1 hypothetical protein E4T40_04292 [Aureobasidium subglaciale]KAI5227448.1 hypothetical protein E4T41_04374 [Aureobasidium subglaciale]KAI5262701.1 hypothetical protein E4T46_04260 [Aureobasidium subglaciale]
MTDEGDQSLNAGSREQTPSQESRNSTTPTPIVRVTLAEPEQTVEATESSEDSLQAEHETEDDVALPKVRSDFEEAGTDEEPSVIFSGQPTEAETEEDSLLSPSSDRSRLSDIVIGRSFSPEDDDYDNENDHEDEDDDQSVTSSKFSDSDSDEESRGRPRISSRSHSPANTFVTRVANQKELEKSTAKRRRSQEGLPSGAKRKATGERSPLAIEYVTIDRDHDHAEVTSPTDVKVIITDPNAVADLKKCAEKNDWPMSPVDRASSLPQSTQDAVTEAFELQEILKLAEAYNKDGPKHTPPQVPERPGTPNFGMSSADAEAEDEDVNAPNIPGRLTAPSSRRVETGSLGHRRSTSADEAAKAKQTLRAGRVGLIQNDLRRLAVNKHHNVSVWKPEDLWYFMRVQEDRVLSLSKVLGQNKLSIDSEGVADVRAEREAMQDEVERMKSELAVAKVAYEKRVLELENEVKEADAMVKILQGERFEGSLVEAITASPTQLPSEVQEGLDKVSKDVAEMGGMQISMNDNMAKMRSMLDVSQVQEKQILALNVDNAQLRNQIVFFEKQAEKAVQRFLNEQKACGKVTKAYEEHKKETAHLAHRNSTLKALKVQTDLELAGLRGQIEELNDTVSELESMQNATVTIAAPVAASVAEKSEPRVDLLERELETTKLSNKSLAGKVATLEHLLSKSEEKSKRFKELYKSANDQRVWSFAHYATLRQPWPIATREDIAQLIVNVINENRLPGDESVQPAESAIHGRSTGETYSELGQSVPELRLPEQLTRDHVVPWLAADMGVRNIFDEIRALGIYLDGRVEDEILRTLIEQGLCYGNYDVFSTFVFSGRPISREEFVTRLASLIGTLDVLEKRLYKAETDRDLAEKKTSELAQRDHQNQLKLKQNAHDLKKARRAMDTFEKHHGSPSGALEDLIVLQTREADLEADMADLREEVAYYEREMAQVRHEVMSDSDLTITGEETCKITAHRELEAKICTLENEKRELVASFNKKMAGDDPSYGGTADDSVIDRPIDYQPSVHDYWAELNKLREESEQLNRVHEIDSAQLPNSPTCPNCSVMRKQIEKLKKNHKLALKRAEETRESDVIRTMNSAEAFAHGEKAELQSKISELTRQLGDASSETPIPTRPARCDDCAYLSSENTKTKIKLRAAQDMVRHLDHRVFAYSDRADTANKEVVRLQTEVDRLNGQSPSVTSTAPTSAGNSPEQQTQKNNRIKELEVELVKTQQLLTDKIQTTLGGSWGATKLAAVPLDQQEDMWDSFETESNHRKLVKERKELREENAKMHKLLDDFETAAAVWVVGEEVSAEDLDRATNIGLQARLDHLELLKADVGELQKLREKNATLVSEKEALITKAYDLEGVIGYLHGNNSPKCCGAVRNDLEKESEAHAVTKSQLEGALAKANANDDFQTGEGQDPCKVVKQELQTSKERLENITKKFEDAESDHDWKVDVMIKDYESLHTQFKDSEKKLKEALKSTTPDENPDQADINDSGKDVKAELKTVKSQYKELEDAFKVNTGQLDTVRKQLREVNLKASAQNTGGNVTSPNDDSKKLREELEATKTECVKSTKQLQELLDQEKQTTKKLQEDLAKAKVVDQPTNNDKNDPQEQIASLSQQLRESAVKIVNLQHRIGELETTKDTYKLAGDRHLPPPEDDQCKDTIMELIGAQTKLKGLIDTYIMPTPETPGTPIKHPKQNTFTEDVFSVFEKFVLRKDPGAESAPGSPTKASHEVPAPRPIANDDPCGVYKKQLRDVQKQCDAFEMLTLYKEKLLRSEERLGRRDKDLQKAKNMLERVVDDSPHAVRKLLNEAYLANRRQANIIECKEIVAAQHAEEMLALHKRLERLRRPNAPMEELQDENDSKKKKLLDLHDEFHKYKIEKGKQLNFLGSQLSILYTERDGWRADTKGEKKTPVKSLWKPAETAKNASTATKNVSQTASAEAIKLKKAKDDEAIEKINKAILEAHEARKSGVKTSEPASKAVSSESKTADSTSKTTESKSTTAGDEEKKEPKEPEPPLPKLIYEFWPCPPPEKQKIFDEAFEKSEKLYGTPVYITKDRLPHHPKPKPSSLFNEGESLRWKLPKLAKRHWYSDAAEAVVRFPTTEWFLPSFYITMVVLDQLDSESRYAHALIDSVYGRERGPHDWIWSWPVLVAAFFFIYTCWITDSLFCRKPIEIKEAKVEESNLMLPDSSEVEIPPKIDPCKDVKKGLADLKFKYKETEEPKKDDTNANADNATKVPKGTTDKAAADNANKAAADTPAKAATDNSKKSVGTANKPATEASNKIATNNGDPCKTVNDELLATKFRLQDAEDRLQGNKTVIDWKNDKRTPEQWKEVENTKFWEIAGVPGPRRGTTITYEDFQKNGGVEFTRRSSQTAAQLAAQKGASSAAAQAGQRAASANTNSVHWAPGTGAPTTQQFSTGRLFSTPELTGPWPAPTPDYLIEFNTPDNGIFASQQGYGSASSAGPDYTENVFSDPSFNVQPKSNSSLNSVIYGPSSYAGQRLDDTFFSNTPFDEAGFFVPAEISFGGTGLSGGLDDLGSYVNSLQGQRGSATTASASDAGFRPKDPPGQAGKNPESAKEGVEPPRTPPGQIGKNSAIAKRGVESPHTPPGQITPPHGDAYDGTPINSSIQKTPSEWVDYLNARQSKSPKIKQTPALPFIYPATDDTKLSYAEFVNRLHSPESAGNSPSKIETKPVEESKSAAPSKPAETSEDSPFNGSGAFDPQTPPPRIPPQYRDGFFQRLQTNEVCCEHEYEWKAARGSLLKNPSEYVQETPRECVHGGTYRIRANNLSSPRAKALRVGVDANDIIMCPTAATPEALSAAWTKFLHKYPNVILYLGEFNEKEMKFGVNASINVHNFIAQRQAIAKKNKVKYPSLIELSLWRAENGFLPPAESEVAILADIVDRRRIDLTQSVRGTDSELSSLIGQYQYTPSNNIPGAFSQIPEAVRNPGSVNQQQPASRGYVAPTYPPGSFWQLPEELRNPGFIPTVRNPTATSPTSNASSYSISRPTMSGSNIDLSGTPGFKILRPRGEDPCKDVKERLEATQKELDFLKDQEDCDEVKKRVKELHEQLSALKILYDPVRTQLTNTEAELEKEKKAHEEAKAQLALADPKTIKTNGDQLAAVKAVEDKLKAAEKEATKKLEDAETEAKKWKKQDAESRKALELEKNRAAPSKKQVEEQIEEQVKERVKEEAKKHVKVQIKQVEVVRPVNKSSWTRFLITLALSTFLGIKYYDNYILGFTPLHEGSALSVTDIIWYDFVELFRDNSGLITTLGASTVGVLVIYLAWVFCAVFDPYPDSRHRDLDGSDGDESGDSSDDDSNDNGGDNNGGDDKKGDSSKKQTKEDNRPKELNTMSPMPWFPLGIAPGSPQSPKSPQKYSSKNPLSWFSLDIAPDSPKLPKSPRSPKPFKTTRQQTWKHSDISSVSTEPSSTRTADIRTKVHKEKDVSPYCKELEDKIEEYQKEVSQAKRELTAAKSEIKALSEARISPSATAPQAGPKADPKRHPYARSAISSVSNAPEVFESVKEKVKETAEEAEKTVEKKAQRSQSIVSTAAETGKTIVTEGLDILSLGLFGLVKDKVAGLRPQITSSTESSVPEITATKSDENKNSKAELEATKKELEAVKKERDTALKELGDIKKSPDAKKGENELWDGMIKGEADWEDPCKDVKKELALVRKALEQAKGEVEFLRKEKKKRESKQAKEELRRKERIRRQEELGEDYEDEDEDSPDGSDDGDDDFPPAGTIEAKFLVKENMLKIREIQLKEAAEQLKACHEANKALRTRMYDAEDGWAVEREGVNTLDQLNSTWSQRYSRKNLSDQGTQTSPVRLDSTQASSGDADHTECNFKIHALTVERDHLVKDRDEALQKRENCEDRQRQAEQIKQENTLKQDATSQEDLDQVMSQLEAANEKLKAAEEQVDAANKEIADLTAEVMRGSSHGLCLTGGKRKIVEENLADLEKHVEEQRADHRHEIEGLRAANRKLKAEIDVKKDMVEKWKREHYRTKDVIEDLHRKLSKAQTKYEEIKKMEEQAFKEAEVSKKLLDAWQKELKGPSPTLPPNLSSDPDTARYQRLLHDKTRQLEMAIYNKEQVQEWVDWYKTREAENHVECNKTLKVYKEKWDKAQETLFKAAEVNDEMQKVVLIGKNKVLEAEKEKRALAKQVEELTEERASEKKGKKHPSPPEVPSSALQDTRRQIRLVEDEARRLEADCNRLARENTQLKQRFEHKIDTLEHAADPKLPVKTAYPTPISGVRKPETDKNKTRPAGIITDFSNLDDPFNDALVTGGLLSAKTPEFNPNRLFDALGLPHSELTPRRKPIPMPIPPFLASTPLTPQGRRRAAERVLTDPKREAELAKERAVNAAYRSAETEFEEWRTDQYALVYSRLRPKLQIPVRNILGQLETLSERSNEERSVKFEESEKKDDKEEAKTPENKKEKQSRIETDQSQKSDDSSGESLDDEEHAIPTYTISEETEVSGCDGISES